VFTVEEAKALRGTLPGGHCKSLFLKDRKGGLWLVVVLEERRLDLKALSERVGAPRFSFGSPDLSGVVATEVRSAMYTNASTRPPVLGFICGLGGREVTVPDVEDMTEIVFQAAKGKSQPLTQWIGLRG
jgi:hypothetical protein